MAARAAFSCRGTIGYRQRHLFAVLSLWALCCSWIGNSGVVVAAVDCDQKDERKARKKKVRRTFLKRLCKQICKKSRGGVVPTCKVICNGTADLADAVEKVQQKKICKEKKASCILGDAGCTALEGCRFAAQWCSERFDGFRPSQMGCPCSLTGEKNCNFGLCIDQGACCPEEACGPCGDCCPESALTLKCSKEDERCVLDNGDGEEEEQMDDEEEEDEEGEGEEDEVPENKCPDVVPPDLQCCESTGRVISSKSCCPPLVHCWDGSCAPSVDQCPDDDGDLLCCECAMPLDGRCASFAMKGTAPPTGCFALSSVPERCCNPTLACCPTCDEGFKCCADGTCVPDESCCSEERCGNDNGGSCCEGTDSCCEGSCEQCCTGNHSFCRNNNLGVHCFDNMCCQQGEVGDGNTCRLLCQSGGDFCTNESHECCANTRCYNPTTHICCDDGRITASCCDSEEKYCGPNPGDCIGNDECCPGTLCGVDRGRGGCCPSGIANNEVCGYTGGGVDLPPEDFKCCSRETLSCGAILCSCGDE